MREQCLSKSAPHQRHGRTIERSEYEQSVQQNRERILLHRDKYKRRQAIVEHPFGTIKRSWGGYYTLLKSKGKVSGEMALLFTCYNLRRAVSIFGIEGLLEALKSRKMVIFGLWRAVVPVCVPRRCPPVWCLWLRADFQPRFSALCA